MSKINDGGSAFPAVSPSRGLNGQPVPENAGMTLRQWYAGIALQGLLSCPKKEPMKLNKIEDAVEAMSASAFFLADAMIEKEQK